MKCNRTLHDEFRHGSASAPEHAGSVFLRFCLSVSALIPIASHPKFVLRGISFFGMGDWASGGFLLREKLTEFLVLILRCLAIQNFLRNGEAQIFVCVCPTLPCAHIIPAVLKKNYKTAGMAPLSLTAHMGRIEPLSYNSITNSYYMGNTNFFYKISVVRNNNDCSTVINKCVFNYFSRNNI